MEGKDQREERKRDRDWVTGLGPDDVINSQRLNPLSHPQQWVSGCSFPSFEGESFFFFFFFLPFFRPMILLLVTIYTLLTYIILLFE
jgi:hypothetical protein